MKILGIETSCDETSAAIVEGNPGKSQIKLLSNVVASSLALHAKTGGIIPEVAAREQVKYIIPVIEEALKAANISQLTTSPPIDAIAVTIGPGLIGSLLVGIETAKTLAYVWDKPIIPVNHLIGHIYANWVLTTNQEQLTTNKMLEVRSQKLEVIFPAIALVVSGGHTDLVLMKSHQKLTWIGGTRDDAAGEAFDKIARLLGLPYPGGPAIAAAAAKSQISNLKSQMKLPRPMLDEDNFDFSFSGLKTAAFREINKLRTEKQFNNVTVQQLSYEVQQAIIDVLVNKTLKAAKKYNVKSILLSGGVAANDRLRKELKVRSKKLAVKFFVPPKNLCTDNAAMIAAAAFFNYHAVSWKSLTANPNLHF